MDKLRGFRGWKTEINPTLASADAVARKRPNGDLVTLVVHHMCLRPELWIAGSIPRSGCAVAVDPLFETIIVSRDIAPRDFEALCDLLEKAMRKPPIE